MKLVGRAEVITADEAPGGQTLPAAIRHGEDALAPPKEALFEAVAEEVFRRYGRKRKRRTLEVNRND